MNQTFGNLSIRGTGIYYRGREPFIPSRAVLAHVAVVSFQPLYSRGLKHIDRDDNNGILDYFHEVSSHGKNVNLYSLREIAKAECTDKFDPVFKDDETFFTDLLISYYEYLEGEMDTSKGIVFARWNT